MKNLIKYFLRLVLKLIPLRIYSYLFQRDCVGLFYHSVSDEWLPYVKFIYPPVPTSRFEQSLIYLKRNYNPVSYDMLHAHVFEGAALPPRAVHLSFDDGYKECYSIVRPLLLKYKIPCTFFVTTDWIDNKDMFYRNKACLCVEKIGEIRLKEREEILGSLNNEFGLAFQCQDDFSTWIMSLKRADTEKIDKASAVLRLNFQEYLKENPIYLTSAQIKEMAMEGFTIGAHTMSHPKLVQVSEKVMEAEIVESSNIVQGITGTEVAPFAFPNSATGIDRKTLSEIRVRNPFLGLFFDTKGMRKDVPFIVNRVWAEKPEFFTKGAKTNIPHLLRDAYQELALENVLAMGRRRK
jgi:peptidoglycan/xylan/chitin deacetylase (PgdA/CDA1 family)